MSRSHFSRILLLCAAALGLARDVRAQNGDLDILSRTVPPIVILQFDTSGSMRNIVLPEKYLKDRGAGSPAVRFNLPTDNKPFPAGCTSDPNVDPNSPLCYAASMPASFLDTKFKVGSTGFTSTEDFQATCQVFNSKTAVKKSSSICFPGTTGCLDDDQDDSDPRGSTATIRCWNVPGGCSNIPASMTCSTTPSGSFRVRTQADPNAVVEKYAYTVITMPNPSDTGSTDYPVNYLWWLAQEFSLGRTVDFIDQDRNLAGRDAMKQLINTINKDTFPPRVKFGLARYDSSANGGYVIVEPSLTNKATLLATLSDPNKVPANSYTPLSETLVDVGRYLAGAEKLGTYPKYSRDLNGGGGTPPASPVTSSCEKLFVIAITDGLPTQDDNNHYTTSGTSGGNSFTQTFSGASQADGSYLDDVAAKLYATDLRKTISGFQNVMTYTVGFTIASPILQKAATAGHGIYFQSNNADDLADSLTQAITDIVSKNTTLTSATVPSTRSAFGNGFYTAYFVPKGRKSVWPGNLEAYTLAPDLTVLDDNNAPAIDPATNLFSEPRHPHWDLGKTLLSDYASRTVYTTKAGKRVPFSAANFIDPTDPNAAYDPNSTVITPAMLALTALDLGNYPAPVTDISITDPNLPATSLTPLGRSVISWVRGTDAFNEDNDPNGDETDARPWVLGDVFHSSPVAVGPPLPFLRFETGYGPAPATPTGPNFMGVFGHRNRVLYVGANDGMLHAAAAGKFVDPSATPGDEYYDSGDGREMFGYVPGLVLNKVKSLPRDDVPKSYYVDGAPTAADAWIDYNGDNKKDSSDWTTVLMTGMREGGEGYLTLDVTDPAAASGTTHDPFPRLMFEFTNPWIGQTWSRPIITRVKMQGSAATGDTCPASTDPNSPNGNCVEQWVAIFGAGYRPEANPNGGPTYITDQNDATYAKAKGIYMVRLSDGAIIARLTPPWPSTLTPVPATSGNFTAMKYAMPAEPAVLDLNSDGFADVVYMGDTGGQLWKWDIHKVGVPAANGMVPTSVWPAGVIFAAPITDMGSGVKHYHSIFQGVGAALSGGALTLSFASGERADLGYFGAVGSDPNNIVGLTDDNNRFWVMKEACPPYKSGCTSFPSPVADETKLTDITTIPSDNNATDLGYFFRVRDGEKFITDNVIFGGVVITLSYLPDAPGTNPEDCALGGSTIEYAWTLANGVGVLSADSGSGSGSGSPTDPPVRNKELGNGAPTNPRLTISKTDDGKIVVNGTVQTSSGEVKHPDGLPPGFDPVQQIFWRQDF